MPVMPRIIMLQAEFEELYPQALALLQKYFGAQNVAAPDIAGLAGRCSGRTDHAYHDFFIIDENALKYGYPGVEVQHFLDTLYGGDGLTDKRVGGKCVELEGFSEPRILIDPLSLVAAIRKGKDFRAGKSVGEVFDEALTPLTLMAGTVVRQPVGEGDRAVILKVRNWDELSAARRNMRIGAGKITK